MSNITRRGFLAATAGILAAAAGCASRAASSPATSAASFASGPTEISDEDVAPDPATLPSTRPGVTRFNYQRIRPAEFKGDLLNPHIGTATFQRFNGDPVNQNDHWNDAAGPVAFPEFHGSPHNDRYPDTTLAYCRWLWSTIEPEKGAFRWDIIDGTLKTAAERGQTLQMRLEPFIGNDIPKWYWEKGGTTISNSKRHPPDHNNPAYCLHFGDLIRAFGKRYDGHPTLESFDIAYGGSCGEMGGNASAQTAAALTDIYCHALPRTQLISMMGTPGCIYAMTLPRPIGWRVDCFGDLRAESDGAYIWNHMHDAYPREPEQAHAMDQWKRAPVILETCWTVGYWAAQSWDIDWILEQGLKYHPSSFMPKSCYIPEKWMDKILAFNRRLGYRFVLRQFDLPVRVAAGQKVRTSVWIDNVGVAPIYHSYTLALRFRQGRASVIVPYAADIRKWMPDNNWFAQHLTIPESLTPGTAQIDMGIIDAAGNAKVKLAIEGPTIDGWHEMCPIEIA